MSAKTGIVLLDKERGLSSARALSAVKKSLSCDKIGHAGTLDPDATGLLVCLLGRATRLASYAEAGDKVYTGEIKLGVRTSTDDMAGEVIDSFRGPLPDFATIQEIAKSFVGLILQVPPKVSALKISGRRAYHLARNGETFELAGREVTISDFQISPRDENLLSFRVACSKGTYIRSIARDLGERLGCGGALASLRREFSYPFSVATAKRKEGMTAEDILSWHTLFPNAILHNVSEDSYRKLLSGDPETRRKILELPHLYKSHRAIILSKGETSGFGLLAKEKGGEFRIIFLED